MLFILAKRKSQLESIMITNGKLIGLFFAKLKDVLTLTLYI